LTKIIVEIVIIQRPASSTFCQWSQLSNPGELYRSNPPSYLDRFVRALLVLRGELPLEPHDRSRALKQGLRLVS
jgi:hypothetical protein